MNRDRNHLPATYNQIIPLESEPTHVTPVCDQYYSSCVQTLYISKAMFQHMLISYKITKSWSEEQYIPPVCWCSAAFLCSSPLPHGCCHPCSSSVSLPSLPPSPSVSFHSVLQGGDYNTNPVNLVISPVLDYNQELFSGSNDLRDSISDFYIGIVVLVRD